MKHHFKTLGLQEGASQEEIKTAYDRLSRELNPSNNDNQEFFKEEYEKVQDAYKALYNSSILATEQGAKSAGNESVGLKESNSNKKKTPVPKKRISKRDFAFGGLLFFIATGIWGVFLQNMGFFVPSNDYTQKVRVINTVDTYSQGGSVDVSGSVDVGNTVDINLENIGGYTPWIGIRGKSAVLGVFSESTTLGK